MRKHWYQKLNSIFAASLTLLLLLSSISHVSALSLETEKFEPVLFQQFKSVLTKYFQQGYAELGQNADENLEVAVLLNDTTEAQTVEADQTLGLTQRLAKLSQIRKVQQEQFLAEVEARLGKKISVHEQLGILVNAIAFTASWGDLKVIAARADVAHVQSNAAFMPKPQGKRNVPSSPMKSGTSFRMARRNQFRGQGQVIAVIDSGFDVNHKDMRIDEPDSVKYNEEQINTKKADFSLKGRWYNIKFPYGYNYMDDNDNLVETAAFSHGTHVAGIAAGSGPYGGQASEAQVLAMRVFSDTQKGTHPVYYAKALEDAVLLQVDTINMSLGASSAVAQDLNPMVAVALMKARKLGASINVSAGNDGHKDIGTTDPKAENPNYATVGVPSISKEAISVASINSLKTMLPVIMDGKKKAYSYTPAAVVPLTEIYGKEYPFVSLGFGRDEDISQYEGQDKPLAGKVAFIERGHINFSVKIDNAAKLGAVAAVIYNDEKRADQTFGMAGIEKTTIPSLTLKRPDALAIMAVQPNRVTIFKDVHPFDFDDAGNLSDFSAWGTSPEYDLKPEITAVGGNVYAAQPGNEYAVESGTSMAAPNISGAMASLQQRIENDSDLITPVDPSDKSIADRSSIAILKKNLLMSSAVPHTQIGTNDPYASPRKQGAGVLNLDNLLNTYAYVTAKATAEDTMPLSKVNLGAVEDQMSFTVTLHNVSKTKTMSFKPVVTVATDRLDENQPLYIVPIGAQRIIPDITSNDVITLEPGVTADYTVNIDISARSPELAAQFINGFHVEGFVRFISQDQSVQNDIGLPYVGFHGVRADGSQGRYVDLPVVERPIYDYEDLTTDHPLYYEMPDSREANPFTALLSGIGPALIVLGETTTDAEGPRSFDRTKIAISPNADGKKDFAAFQGTFINHFTNAGIKIFDAQGTPGYVGPVLYDGQTEETVGRRSNVIEGRPESYESRSERSLEWLWDGQKAGVVTADKYTPDQIVEDGVYRLEFTAQGILPDSKVQKLSFDIIVDTKKPEYQNPSFTEASSEMSVAVAETGSGIETIVLEKRAADGSVTETVVLQPDASGQVNFAAPKENWKDWYLVAEDYAANENAKSLALIMAEDKVGKLVLNFKNVETQALVDLEKEMYELKITDAEGRVHPDAENLLHGDYKVEMKMKTLDYDVVEAVKSFTISDAEKAPTVVFDVKANQVFDINIHAAVFPHGERITERVILYATSEDGRTAELVLDGTGATSTPVFEGRLTAGNWTFEVRGLSEEWQANPSNFTLTVKDNGHTSDDDKIVTLILGETMSIAPIIVNEGGELTNQDVQFIAYDGHIEYTDLSVLAKQRYVVYPKEVPEGYSVFPDHALVDPTDGEANPEFKFVKLTNKTRGRITVKTLMSPADLEPIQVEYYATDLMGNVQESIDDLPWGTYYVKVLHYDKGYTTDTELVKVVVNAENPDPVVEYVWKRLADSQNKRDFTILANFNPRSIASRYKNAINDNWEFTIENLTTGEVRAFAGSRTSMGVITVPELPFGLYRITPKNVAAGYAVTPNYAYAVVNEDTDPESNNHSRAIFTFARRLAPIAPIRKLDDATQVEVTLPVDFLSQADPIYPPNPAAYKLIVDPILDPKTGEHETTHEYQGLAHLAKKYDMRLINLAKPNAEKELRGGMEGLMFEKWTVKIPVGEYQNPKVLYLSKTGLGDVLIPHTIEEVDGIQKAVFQVDHFSEYAILGDPVPARELEKDGVKVSIPAGSFIPVGTTLELEPVEVTDVNGQKVVAAYRPVLKLGEEVVAIPAGETVRVSLPLAPEEIRKQETDEKKLGLYQLSKGRLIAAAPAVEAAYYVLDVDQLTTWYIAWPQEKKKDHYFPFPIPNPGNGSGQSGEAVVLPANPEDVPLTWADIISGKRTAKKAAIGKTLNTKAETGVPQTGEARTSSMVSMAGAFLLLAIFAERHIRRGKEEV